MAREGARWSWEHGPPVEAYGRVTNPERFRGLHRAGRQLLDALAEDFEVEREVFLDEQRPDGPEPAELLVPATSAAASFGLTFTEAPGVVIWRNGQRSGHLPMCACDACDETSESCLSNLHAWADTVSRGAFGDTLSIGYDCWVHTSWFAGSTGGRGESRRTVTDDAEVEALLAEMPNGQRRWAAWTPRPGREPRQGTQATGTVRTWTNPGSWGVIDSPDTPGGCWANHSHLVMSGVPLLKEGQTVTFDWETPPRWETVLGRHIASSGETPTWLGWPYRATRVQPAGEVR